MEEIREQHNAAAIPKSVGIKSAIPIYLPHFIRCRIGALKRFQWCAYGCTMLLGQLSPIGLDMSHVSNLN